MQGSSVVEALANSPTYHIRAVTRNPQNEKALALTSKGSNISVAQADLNDSTSLSQVFQNAHAIYLVTDFWATPLEPETEFKQATAALKVISGLPSLEHLVWSSLPSMTAASNGRYKNVLHFDSKARITEHLKATYPDLWRKTTELWIAPYFQNWVKFPMFGPEKRTDGVWELKTVDEGMCKPMVDVGDTGKTVRAILERGVGIFGGKTVSLVAENELTDRAMLELWGTSKFPPLYSVGNWIRDCVDIYLVM
jgi:NmrA-like family